MSHRVCARVRMHALFHLFTSRSSVRCNSAVVRSARAVKHTHTMQTIYRFRSTPFNRCGLSEQYKTSDGWWWVNSPSASKSNRASQLNAGKYEWEWQAANWIHRTSTPIITDSCEAHNIVTRKHEKFHNRHISVEMKPNNWRFSERFAMIDWFRYRFDDLIYDYLDLGGLGQIAKIELNMFLFTAKSIVQLFACSGQARDTHALELLTRNRPIMSEHQ